MIIMKYTYILKYFNYFCVLVLIGCAKQSEKQKNVTEKFSPTHYIALTNINLDMIQSSKRKALIDELNSLPCHCSECTPGISLAQCINTNNFCQFSKVQSKKIIQKYQNKYYANKKLTYSIWDATRSSDLNAIYRHLIRNTDVNKQNVRGETPIYLSLKSNNYQSSLFLMLSGASLAKNDYSDINPREILNQTEWGLSLMGIEKQYNNTYKKSITILLKKIFDKLDWALDEVTLLSINNKTWPDASLGQNQIESQLQIIVKGIQIQIEYKKIDYALNFPFLPHHSTVKLIEINSNKELFKGDLNF